LSRSTGVISIYNGKIPATSSGIGIHHGTSTPSASSICEFNTSLILDSDCLGFVLLVVMMKSQGLSHSSRPLNKAKVCYSFLVLNMGKL
jgi:hypothetical protein